MKKLLTFFGLLFLLVGFAGCAGSAATQSSAPAESITYQHFYDNLSPYGTWIDYPSYGHVWHPSVQGDFRPYLTNGYWDYSTEGWMWMSSYSWGWAPFHYGRWIYEDMYGWLWIPGYEWSPAWVTWGGYDGYYAWAPLMPGINVGVAYNSWHPAAMYWNVCARNHICDANVTNVVEQRNVVVNNVKNINIINSFNTTGSNNHFYAKGPDVNEVQRYTGRKIEPAAIRNAGSNNAPVSPVRQGNEIKAYRPPVNQPQPKEFRQVGNSPVNPIRTNEDRMQTKPEQQVRNIEQLPVHRAPVGGFNPGNSPIRKH